MKFIPKLYPSKELFHNCTPNYLIASKIVPLNIQNKIKIRNGLILSGFEILRNPRGTRTQSWEPLAYNTIRNDQK
jgi:hypothetical protein